MTDDEFLFGAGVVLLLLASSGGSKQAQDFQLPEWTRAGSYTRIADKLMKAARARGVAKVNGIDVPLVTNREAVALLREWRAVPAKPWTDATALEKIASDASSPASLFPDDATARMWLGIQSIARDVDAANATSDEYDIYSMHLDRDAGMWPVWR